MKLVRLIKMINVNVFFSGVVFNCEIECDDNLDCYAMTATVEGCDWIDNFNLQAEKKFNERLQVALRIQAAEDELERLLSERNIK